MNTTPKHVGYALDEFTGAVIPLRSFFSSKRAAEKAAPDLVERATGLKITGLSLFPPSREEEAREMVDRVVADSHGYFLLPSVDLVPHSAEIESAAYREHCEAPTTCKGLDAAACIALLASWGIPARMSKGLVVWALADSSRTDLASCGLRFSEKRGLWWITPTGAGGAIPEPCKLSDFAACAA